MDMKKTCIAIIGILTCLAVYGGYYLENLHAKTQTKAGDDVKQMDDDVVRQDRQAITEQYHTMYRYMLVKDVDRLAEMLDDDFVLVHMTGLQQTKKEYLRCIREGELNYFTEETDHIFIELQEDSAVLTGQSRVNAAVFGGGRHTWPLQLAITMKKQSGKWLLTGAVASTY